MKAERVSEHIWSLKAWMMFPMRVWVVAGEGGVTLIDAGMPFMAGGIMRFIEQLGAGPLRRILLTHGHGDHVGSVPAIRQRFSVPVYAHPIEIPYLEGAMAYPRRRKAAASLPPGLVQGLSPEREGELAKVGDLQPYLTPGHSPGHVVYYHEQDRVLLAGDLFTTKRGQLRPPMAMFTGDMAEAVRSSAIVGVLQPKRLEICHGEPVFDPAAQLPAYLATATASA